MEQDQDEHPAAASCGMVQAADPLALSRATPTFCCACWLCMLAYYVLLTDLGTLTASTMQVAGSHATFTLQTQPTPQQQRCFELLGVTPTM